jgi:hypothetical protein
MCFNFKLHASVITTFSSFLLLFIFLIKESFMHEIFDPVSIIAYFSIPTCSITVDNTLVL